jgi:hypothetical protein
MQTLTQQLQVTMQKLTHCYGNANTTIASHSTYCSGRVYQEKRFIRQSRNNMNSNDCVCIGILRSFGTFFGFLVNNYLIILIC